jgi:L-rhamnose mutarotase
MNSLIQRLSLLALLLCASCQTTPPERYAMVIGLKPSKVAEYKKLHAEPWQGVLQGIDRSNIRNFSIWHIEESKNRHLLFAYFEYHGKDLAADFASMGECEITREWWKLTDPCQTPIPAAKAGEQWVMMEEFFFRDKSKPGAPLMPPPGSVEVGKAE